MEEIYSREAIEALLFPPPKKEDQGVKDNENLMSPKQDLPNDLLSHGIKLTDSYMDPDFAK